MLLNTGVTNMNKKGKNNKKPNKLDKIKKN